MYITVYIKWQFNIFLLIILMNELNRPSTVCSTRRSSFSMRRKSSVGLTEQVKENQLQWMFNRRKDQLAKTSEQNIQLYLRIKAQKSRLGQFGRKKSESKPKGNSLGWKENEEEIMKINNEIEKRGRELKSTLKAVIDPITSSKITSRFIRW